MKSYHAELEKNGYVQSYLPEPLYEDLRRITLGHLLYKINSSKQHIRQLAQSDNDLKDPQSIDYAMFSNLGESFIRSTFGHISSRYLPSPCIDDWVAELVEWIELNTDLGQPKLHTLRPEDLDSLFDTKCFNQSTPAVWCRIVAPGSKPGFAHRDSDFWLVDDLPKINFDYQRRLKIWLPIAWCNKQNSLHILSKSHLLDIKTNFVPGIDGRTKPKLDLSLFPPVEEWDVPAFEHRSFVIFDDNTVHTGVKNDDHNLFPRISVETTLFF